MYVYWQNPGVTEKSKDVKLKTTKKYEILTFQCIYSIQYSSMYRLLYATGVLSCCRHLFVTNDCILYLNELSKIPTLAWAIKQEIMSQVRIPLIIVVDSA
jgi:hypothetical protein